MYSGLLHLVIGFLEGDLETVLGLIEGLKTGVTHVYIYLGLPQLVMGFLVVDLERVLGLIGGLKMGVTHVYIDAGQLVLGFFGDDTQSALGSGDRSEKGCDTCVLGFRSRRPRMEHTYTYTCTSMYACLEAPFRGSRRVSLFH